MALNLPFLNGPVKRKRSKIISVDLGSRTTKAALLERRGEGFALTRYVVLDAPIYDKKISVEQLSDHLNSVAEALGRGTKFINVAVGLGDSVVRLVEMPPLPVDEMRTILKMNHKSYLQQDLPGHTFDCFVISQAGAANGAQPSAQRKMKVLAAAAKKQLVSDLMQAADSAGLVADMMIPSLVGPVNAFEAALPEVYAKETIALVDIGFKSTSVCVLDRGELSTNRVVSLGGDQLTAGLAETMNISYAEAEGIKIGMAPEVESALQMQVFPLGREIRASLDFFEHQQDRPVSQVYVSGASARSEMIMQMLHSELLVECKSWSPTSSLTMALSGQQATEIDHVASQLTVAIGTGLAAN